MHSVSKDNMTSQLTTPCPAHLYISSSNQLRDFISIPRNRDEQPTKLTIGCNRRRASHCTQTSLVLSDLEGLASAISLLPDETEIECGRVTWTLEGILDGEHGISYSANSSNVDHVFLFLPASPVLFALDDTWNPSSSLPNCRSGRRMALPRSLFYGTSTTDPTNRHRLRTDIQVVTVTAMPLAFITTNTVWSLGIPQAAELFRIVRVQLNGRRTLTYLSLLLYKFGHYILDLVTCWPMNEAREDAHSK